MGYIELKTEIPGPRSKELLKKREDSIARGLATNLSIGIAEADGAIVMDIDGNRLIDLAGGIGSLNAGHTPKAVVDALKRQLDHYINPVFPVVLYDSYIQLAEKLNHLVPGNFSKKTVLFNSGAEANENAIKIARRYTKRSGVISFERGFHGRTFMTMSMTSKVKGFKKGFGTMATEVYHLPYPYPYRDTRTTIELLEAIDNLFQMTVDPSEIAAIVIEPVQGDGGIVVPNREFFEGIRKLCTQHGIVFIADEVQTGFARTGKFFAMEHFGVAADITVMGKSIGAGIPLSAVTGNAEIMDAPEKKELGTTLGGTPLGCVAGLKVIEDIENNNLMVRAQEIGNKIRSKLTFPSKFVGEVRGLGAMIGIEFVKDLETKEPYPELVKNVVRKCHENGVIVITAGSRGNIIRLLPPLIINDKQLNEALDVIVNVIKQIENNEETLTHIE
ncbi:MULTISPECIES: 4-aminobutyrate--2-oxoglutarate transaminase [unclassified Oceanobacillus]|uniref:4-aminobutyrate--2-oxoglutarate transaminase n=1 Tax=unclassified Oceanobacillus TaxID=2630292 RepID=UPI00300E179F